MLSVSHVMQITRGNCVFFILLLYSLRALRALNYPPRLLISSPPPPTLINFREIVFLKIIFSNQSVSNGGI